MPLSQGHRERARMVLGTEGDRREKEKSCSSGVKLQAADAIFFLPFTIFFLEERGCRSCYDTTETCIYRGLASSCKTRLIF